jgi:ABC-type transporter Mla maintaining outer membrane lipid asymmetry ATPase subunit MlaF
VLSVRGLPGGTVAAFRSLVRWHSIRTSVGKSITMCMILGLDRPTTGSALVNGRPYGDLKWPLHEVGAIILDEPVNGLDPMVSAGSAACSNPLVPA